ncbi:hypothetical protein HanIR_Chr01g0019661 [Helianthus annuus]|nr:hypothetical protein HanIR_Chr01g0019661 [Helianthus annuus]
MNLGECLSYDRFVLIVRVFAGSGSLWVNWPITLETINKIYLELDILLILSLRGSRLLIGLGLIYS